MDVHCSTCGEPWDVYHLWHDAVFETALSHEEAEAWRLLPRAVKLNERYRKEFHAAGWEFGQGVINVIRCPGCPKNAKPNLERMQTKAALEDLMGDEEDGLAATFEDYRL
ncbi:hypothetical protein LBMAG56_50670 [Verrucomicrobiota bacterium]|nr:hypothetical protein LBMAG56_50670 [Verrucomicrobiota bacterium]